MITLEYPAIEELPLINVKLEEPRKVIHPSYPTKGKKMTRLPLNLIEDGGVYIVKLSESILYVGETSNFKKRIMTHLSQGILADYPDIKHVYFYKEEDYEKRMLAEAVYKAKYLGRFSIGGKYSKFG